MAILERGNSENFNFNGFNFKEHMEANGYMFKINSTRGRGVFGKEISTRKVTGVDGVSVLETSLPSRTIEVDYTIQAKDLLDLREAESYLTVLLQTRDVARLYFADQEGYYEAHFENLEVGYEDDRVQQGTITFFCPKPFRYKDYITALDNHNLAANEPVVVNTESSYFSLPIIRLVTQSAIDEVILNVGGTEIKYEQQDIPVGTSIEFNSETLECKVENKIKVIEVTGEFPILYTIQNNITVNVDCTITLNYRGIDV